MLIFVNRNVSYGQYNGLDGGSDISKCHQKWTKITFLRGFSPSQKIISHLSFKIPYKYLTSHVSTFRTSSNNDTYETANLFCVSNARVTNTKRIASIIPQANEFSVLPIPF